MALPKLAFKVGIDGDQELVARLGKVEQATGKIGPSAGRMADGSNKAADGMGRMAADSNKAADGMGRMTQQGKSATSALRLLGGVIGGLSFAAFARDLLAVNVEFDRLQASLKTVTGSADAAEAAFAQIQDFATTTPFQLSEVTSAFIKMKSMGLDASMGALRSYGNTASAMGKDLNQMIEAVADAATGEFERLKEFGIRASQQGDQVSLTFQGVTTTIGKNATEIEDYLRRIGDTQFAGGMSEQMETLGGKISNLSDAWDQFLRTIGESGAIEVAAGVIEGMTTSAQRLSNTLALYDAYASGGLGFWEFLTMGPEEAANALKSTDFELRTLQRTVSELEKQKQGNFWWTQSDESALQAARDGLAGYQKWLRDTAALEEKLAAKREQQRQPDKRVREEEIARQAASLEKLQAENRKRWGEDIRAAGKIADIWQTKDRERFAVHSRGVDAQIAKEQEQIAAAEQITDVWLSAARERQAASDRAAASEAAKLDQLIDTLEQFKRAADPAYAAMQEIREVYESLGEMLSAGLIDENEYARLAAAMTDHLLPSLDEVGAATQRLGQNFDKAAGGAMKAMRIMLGGLDRESEHYKNLELAIQATNVARAVAAVMTQGSGDPYTAFARMASMAAVVASFGVQLSGGASVGNADISAERQAVQGTGTVLGDSAAKSESILKATEITAEATNALVGINRDMLTALQQMRDGITGASGLIVRAGQPFNTDLSKGIVANPLESLSRGAYLHGDLLDKTLGSLGSVGTFLSDLGRIPFDIIGGAIDWIGKLIGGSSSVRDQGIEILGGTMADIVDDTLVRSFQVVKSKKYAWSSSKKKTYFADVDDAVSQQFSLVFDAIADSVVAGAKSLGMTDVDISDAMSVFMVETMRISLKGLSGEEQAAELEAVFSTLFDNLSGAVVPWLDEFQQVGEGLGETLARVASNVQVAEEAISRLGFQAERLGVEQFVGLSVALVEAAGGLEAFIGGMNSFIENFASDDHQFELLTSDLVRSLERVGLSVPDTRDGMWQLMQTLDATTESGRKHIATLLSVSGLADEYYTELENRAEKELRIAEQTAAEELRIAEQAAAEILRIAEEQARERQRIASERAGLELRLLQMLGDQVGLQDLERQALDESNRGLYDQINALQQLQDATVAATEAERNFAAERERIANERAGLEVRLLQMLGDTAALRERELAATDPANRGLLKQIFALEDISPAQDIIAGALQDEERQLADHYAARREITTAAYEAEKSTLENSLSAARQKMREYAAATDRLAAARERMALQDEKWAANQYRTAQDQLTAVLQAARGGDFSGVAGLDNAIDTLTGITPNAYATQTEYQRNYWKTYTTLGALEKLTAGQVTTAERTVSVLELQLATAAEHQEQTLAALDSQHQADQAYAQARHAANLNDLDRQRQAIREAMDRQSSEAKTALTVAQTGSAGIQTAVTAGTQGIIAELRALNGSLGQVLTPAPAVSDRNISDYVAQALASTTNQSVAFLDIYLAAQQYGVSSARLAAATGLAQQDILDWVDSAGLPMFAAGGITSGLSIAGEAGPEAVVPLPDGRSIPVTIIDGGNRSDLTEVRALLRDLLAVSRSVGADTVKSHRRLREIIEDWDQGGLPETRAA